MHKKMDLFLFYAKKKRVLLFAWKITLAVKNIAIKIGLVDFSPGKYGRRYLRRNTATKYLKDSFN